MRFLTSFTILFLFFLPAIHARDHALAPATTPEARALEQGDGLVGFETVPRVGAPKRFQGIDDHWVLPWYEVDRRSAGGLTTLLAIRNPFDRPALVEISYRSVSGGALAEDLFELAGNATRTINLRDVTELRADPDGIARGFAVIDSDLDTSTDFFLVTPEDNFATGGRLINDVCRIWGLRYLSGGLFSGGTELQLFVLNPLGADPRTDPPTAVVTVHSESGERIGTVNVWTANRVMELTAREILDTLSAPAPPFGAFEIRFTDDTERGYVQGANSAQGRFSIGLVGSCLKSF